MTRNMNKDAISDYFKDLLGQIDLSYQENGNFVDEKECMQWYEDCFENLENAWKYLYKNYKDDEDRRFICSSYFYHKDCFITKLRNENFESEEFSAFILMYVIEG